MKLARPASGKKIVTDYKTYTFIHGVFTAVRVTFGYCNLGREDRCVRVCFIFFKFLRVYGFLEERDSPLCQPAFSCCRQHLQTYRRLTRISFSPNTEDHSK